MNCGLVKSLEKLIQMRLLLESRASSWSNLNLGDQSLVLTQQSFQLSLGILESWVWDGVADVLNNLVLGNPKKSLVILLDNVESGFEFAEFSSQVSVSSNNLVELSIVSSSDSSLKTVEFSSQLIVLGTEVIDVRSIVSDSVVKILIINFMAGLSFISFGWNNDCGVNIDIIFVVVLSFNWLGSGGLDRNSNFLFDWNFNNILNNDIVFLFDDSINWLLDFNNLLNVDWLFDSSLDFDFNDLFDGDWSFNSSLNNDFLVDDIFVGLLLELWNVDFNDVLLGNWVVLVNNIFNWDLSNLLNWLRSF